MVAEEQASNRHFAAGLLTSSRTACSSLLAERQFSRDLAFALWLPLVLAAFAARSCNAPGAAPGTCEAGRDRGLALSSFPCGAAPIAQVRA